MYGPQLVDIGGRESRYFWAIVLWAMWPLYWPLVHGTLVHQQWFWDKPPLDNASCCECDGGGGRDVNSLQLFMTSPTDKLSN